MPFPEQQKRPFTKTGIEVLTQNQMGIYGIFNDTGCIYIGQGDIRERLLRHLNGDIPCILVKKPIYYLGSVVSDHVQREKLFIMEYKPSCNQRLG